MLNWLLILILFTLFFQKIGFITIIISYIIFLLFKEFSQKDSVNLFINNDTEGSILQKVEQYEFDIKEDIFDISKINSYQDILYSGTENEKIDLIGMVAFNPTKEFISLIRIALNDENEIVRILASNSLQKFENYFEEKIELERKLFNENKNKKHILNLINIYDKYVSSTLLDEFLHKKYIDKIFVLFKSIKNIETEKDIYYLYLKLSIKYNCTDDLHDKLINFIKKNHSYENIFMICEYFYKISDFEEIHKYLEKIDMKKLKSQNLKNIYQFWMINAI